MKLLLALLPLARGDQADHHGQPDSSSLAYAPDSSLAYTPDSSSLAYTPVSSSLAYMPDSSALVYTPELAQETAYNYPPADYTQTSAYAYDPAYNNYYDYPLVSSYRSTPDYQPGPLGPGQQGGCH
jgi:hypothetical protein